MTFKSKRDRKYTLIMYSTVVIIDLVMLVPLLIDPRGFQPAEVATIISITALITAGLLWLFYGISYTFRDDCLIVRGGPFRSRIPYDEITKVASAKDLWMGYRLLMSDDAIEIFYKQAIMGSVKISPVEKEQFMDELNKRCKHAQFTL